MLHLILVTEHNSVLIGGKFPLLSLVSMGQHTPRVIVSVHLSVTLVDCIETAEDIVKLLSQPSSPSFSLLFPSTDT